MSFKHAITTVQAAVVAIIIVIATIVGTGYYLTLTASTPTPTAAPTPTPKPTPTPTPTPLLGQESEEWIEYFNQGNALYREGRYDEAIAKYTKAIELNPREAVIYVNRGSAYIKLDQYDLALADLNKSIELDPTNALAYAKRGFVYYKKGFIDLATADFQKVIQLSTDPELTRYAEEALEALASAPRWQELYIPDLNGDEEGVQTLRGQIIYTKDGPVYRVWPESLIAYGGQPLSGYTWTVATGSVMPAGTIVDALTGVFHSSGGQILPGRHKFDMTVSDGSTTATATYVFVVDTYDMTASGSIPMPVPVPEFQQPQVPYIYLPDAITGHGYGASLWAYGVSELPWSWYLDSGELPPGLVVDQVTGVVRGTPFSSAAGKTYQFTVKVVDRNGNVAIPGPTYVINVPR